MLIWLKQNSIQILGLILTCGISILAFGKLENDIQKLQKLMQNSKIFEEPMIFTAYSNSGCITNGNYIDFTNFLTNFGVGDQFTLKTGTFNSSKNGIYEFSFSGYHEFNGNTGIIVEKNGEPILSSLGSFNLKEHGLTSGFGWQVQLNVGDTIRLKVSQGKIYGGSFFHRIFNGKLLTIL